MSSSVAALLVDYSVPITLVVVGVLGIFATVVVSPAASWALVGVGAGWMGIETAFVLAFLITSCQTRRKANNENVQLDLQKPKIDEAERAAPSTGEAKPPASTEAMFKDKAV